MIERKITFQHMQHSVALENHTNERINKIEKLLENLGKPKSVEVFLKYNPHRAHHEVEVHLVNKEIKAEAHASEPDIYSALDEAMDKIVHAIKKMRGIQIDEHHKVSTPKTDFYKDE